jgi:hypothetical protein
MKSRVTGTNRSGLSKALIDRSRAVHGFPQADLKGVIGIAERLGDFSRFKIEARSYFTSVSSSTQIDRVSRGGCHARLPWRHRAVLR